MSDKTAKQVFNEALDLIRDPKRWTQGAMARDHDGLSLAAGDDTASVCWCSEGAVEHVCNTFYVDYEDEEKSEVLVMAALDNAALLDHEENIHSFNDNHTHSEVIALWEKVGREKGWLE